MARIAGIKTQTDSRGKLASITINAKKHPNAVEALKGLGLLEKSALRQEVEANPDNFLTVEEARAQTHEFIKKLPWKKL